MVLGCLPLVVAGLGSVLVAAAPADQRSRCRASWPGLVIRCVKRLAISLRVRGICPSGSGLRVVFGGGGDGEEGGGEHGEGDPPVPGGPAADLVLVQAGQALAGLEVLLDGPAQPGDLDQRGQGDRLRARSSGRRPVPRCCGCGGSAASGIPGAVSADGDPGPVVLALALGAFAGGQPLPGPLGQPGGELIGADGAPGPGGDPVIARHGQHVARSAACFQPGAQRARCPRRPRRRRPRRTAPRRRWPARSSAWPAAAWSRTPRVLGDPGGLRSGPGHRSRTSAGTAPGRSARARPRAA